MDGRPLAAAAPNEKWLTDITEFQIPAGKVYLSPVIDCFDSLVISWSIGTHPDAELVTRCCMRPSRRWSIPTTGPSSTRSRRPLSLVWLAIEDRRCEAHSLDVSQGVLPDNAACEGFFGRLKTELFYPGDWKATTIEQFIEVVDSYIRWYNEKRIKISLALSAPSSTERVLDLRHKTSPSFCPHPPCHRARLRHQTIWRSRMDTNPPKQCRRRLRQAEVPL